MLNAYVHSSKEQEEATKAFVGNCQRVLAAARPAGVPVYYARADHRHDGMDAASLYNDTNIAGEPWPDPEDKPFKPYLLVYAGDWSSEVISELQPMAEDYIIAKHRWNAFYQTHLELSLRTRGIDTVVLCGGATEVGIAATAYSARDSDFNVVVVSDACRSGNQDNHDQFMNRIFPFMARVRTTDQVVEMIEVSK
jgi:nicotinamidase-related amidase